MQDFSSYIMDPAAIGQSIIQYVSHIDNRINIKYQR